MTLIIVGVSLFGSPIKPQLRPMANRDAEKGSDDVCHEGGQETF